MYQRESTTRSQSTIAIIGAGIIGVATARRLLSAGYSVTLIDLQLVHEATWAAAGMLPPVAEVTWDQHTLYPLMVNSARMYPEFLNADTSLKEETAGYRRTGTLVCAADAADREYLTQLSALQESMGMDVEAITRRQAR